LAQKESKESDFRLYCPKFIRESTTDLPGVKQVNRRDIQEQILGFASVDF
jgi:hypothetical protein